MVVECPTDIFNLLRHEHTLGIIDNSTTTITIYNGY